MIDIVKEIMEVQENGFGDKKEIYFRQETMIDREYFNQEVIEVYPNLEFIRIFMKKTNLIYTFHETERDIEYCLYSVFIDKNMLEYIANEGLISSVNREKVIDLSEFRWEKQIELRNKIFRACPIILAEYNAHSDDTNRILGNSNMGLSKNISIYHYNFKIDCYELMKATNFILISNSILISQKELDDLCLKILEKLSIENKRVIAREKEIYLSIKDKLKRNRTLNQEERKILDKFISEEMAEIEKKNTLLVRSRNLNNESGV